MPLTYYVFGLRGALLLPLAAHKDKSRKRYPAGNKH
ncbi:uncharacterized protein FTOL_12649 [Fusarium torulosum]|uniref:Uncharacterized protein n=1 Tax=Fusarium torulosum TaxID=33205 RepID=A0AAE8MM96_9HYPO|nr:uncharacterized protein FTOL_12649 [Fusarium torulosum]